MNKAIFFSVISSVVILFFSNLLHAVTPDCLILAAQIENAAHGKLNGPAIKAVMDALSARITEESPEARLQLLVSAELKPEILQSYMVEAEINTSTNSHFVFQLVDVANRRGWIPELATLLRAQYSRVDVNIYLNGHKPDPKIVYEVDSLISSGRLKGTQYQRLLEILTQYLPMESKARADVLEKTIPGLSKRISLESNHSHFCFELTQLFERNGNLPYISQLLNKLP